jgi:uncharacterized phage protein gp47/JayE
MTDLNHYIGGDLSIGPAGDLSLTTGSLETRQRVLRRLCTNPGAVIHHLAYGAGLPTKVGQSLSGSNVAGIARSQMLLEQGVQQTPPPSVTAQIGFNLIALDLNYVDAVSGQQVFQGFDVTGGSALQTWSQLVATQAAAIQKFATTLVNFTTGSVLRALTEAVADVCLFIQTQIMQVLAQTRASTSSGSDLDTWAADYGFLRLAATDATGQVTFSRYSPTAQAIVPVGAQVQSADGTQQFTVLADTTNTAYSATVIAGGGFIIAANVSSVTVTVQAQNAGAQGNVLAGVITQILQAISGVDTVTNGAAFTNGLDAESDIAMRARFILYITSLSKATKNAVAAAILSVQQGLTYTLTEDLTYTGSAAPGTFYVVVDNGTGAPGSAIVNLVYAAIDAVRAVGISFAVYQPVVITANWSLTITVGSAYVKATYQPIVQSAINLYINSLTLGQSLPYTKLEQIAYEAAPGIITNVTAVGLNSGTSDLTATNQQVIKAGTGVVS